ncbi:MAG: hypothetical protein PUC32_05380 [Oscillospiraceae bacterium]|nr:hypothetical protein [Oscillospiraceae bacterium]
MIRVSEIVLPLDIAPADKIPYLTAQAAKRLKLPAQKLQSVKLVKQSVDARKKEQVVFRCTVDVTVKGEQAVLAHAKDKKAALTKPYAYVIPPCRVLSQRPVVVGFGPAGMFSALLLAQAGQRPIVLERGSAVEERQCQVHTFWQTGVLDPQCNVQFGEGGAGTFSDGKLNTGIKDPRARKVLEELHAAGAPEEILYQAHPHVGTDRLPQTVRGIRETIRKLGGTVLFNTQLTDLTTKNGCVTGVTAVGPEGRFHLESDHVILAIGHSARDTYEMLVSRGVTMVQKPFSVGARIEHPQLVINKGQYGAFAQHPALGAAEYKLSVHLENGRGVYTFCMCPGGEVVASASEEGMVVTNGMSNFARDGANANSALLVGIGPEDFGSDHPLAGMYLQRKLERSAFNLGGGAYRAPGQRVEDFLQNRPSTHFGDVVPTYQRGVTPCALSALLPDFVTESMAEGIRKMDHRLKGFAYPDAVLTAVETRSSAPVRLLRDEQMQSLSLKGLYPCGEGAGYAGGIVSAGVDGLKCAEMVLQAVRKEN